jgi:hypothetical protein
MFPPSPEFVFWIGLLIYLLLFLGVIAFAISHIRNLANIAQQISSLRTTLAPASAPQPTESLDHEALRLQACERFTLMLERISVPNLLLRLPATTDQSSREYTAQLLLTIRQEVEYNITQQIYVSDSLWQIISQSRDHIGMLIARSAEGAESSLQIAQRLRKMSSQLAEDPVALAQGAIRREAASVLTA